MDSDMELYDTALAILSTLNQKAREQFISYLEAIQGKKSQPFYRLEINPEKD